MRLGERLLRKLTRPMGRIHVRLYRLSGGALGGRIGRAPVLLLTTTGRRTGQQRTTPLLYLADGDRLVVVASYGGAPRHPAWFLNLEATPDVVAQVRRDSRPVRAREATVEEREVYWPRLVAIYRYYDSYQRKTSRTIPVVILEPRPVG
ncbi:MAG: nitroreductase family deazaflavin-dependent oxidoreductase [Actinomycetota bacterium]